MDLNREQIDLKARLNGEWWELCKKLGVRDNNLISETFSILVSRYSEPHRHYHDLSHVAHCLEELKDARHLCKNPDAVEMALWFHDAVYDVRRDDNESCSAILCTNSLMSMGLSKDAKFILQAHAMILFTMHKELPIYDAQFVVDIDLSSLGASPEIFDENTEKIFLEYHEGRGLTREEYNAGRVKFIEGMLPPNRPYIYSTEFFKQKHEAQAQENLNRVLRNLKAGA